MATYYRLQSNKYDVTPDTKVTIWACNNEIDAMKRDCERWGIECNNDNTEDIWNQAIAEGREGYYRLPGVSCTELPEELIEYFDCEDRDSLEQQSGYILIFEGEWQQLGTDGEDVVKFEREINRITIEEFLSIYEDSYKRYVESGMSRFE